MGINCKCGRAPIKLAGLTLIGNEGVHELQSWLGLIRNVLVKRMELFVGINLKCAWAIFGIIQARYSLFALVF